MTLTTRQKIHPPCYLCFVENAGRPGVGHSTLEAARTEAKRLSESSGKRVWIFATLEALEPPENAPSGRKIIRVKKPVDESAKV